MREALLAPALLLAAIMPAQAYREDPSPARELEGRTPGKPASCIEQRMIDGTTLYKSGDILYRMRNGTAYLNSPRPACLGLRGSSGLVTRTPSSSLCRGDIANVVDFTSHMDYGGCALGDFVPYSRKPRR